MRQSFDWTGKEKEIEYIREWYPHIGNRVEKDLGLPKGVSGWQVRQLGLKKLPKSKRLCILCRKNKIYCKPITDGKEIVCGNKCLDCYYSRHRFYHARRMKKDPLRTRLKANLKADIKNVLKKGLPVDITVDDLIEKNQKQKGMCFYTGNKMTSSSEMRGRGKWDYDSVSIDRIIPIKGYTKDNIVLCCFWANTAKLDLTYNELVERCKRVIEHEQNNRSK